VQLIRFAGGLRRISDWHLGGAQAEGVVADGVLVLVIVVAGAFIFAAADFVGALKFKAADGERVVFRAVIAAPGVDPDGAFAIDAIVFFERGCHGEISSWLFEFPACDEGVIVVGQVAVGPFAVLAGLIRLWPAAKAKRN